MKKRILWGMLALTSTVAPLAAVVSCGCTSDSKDVSKNGATTNPITTNPITTNPIDSIEPEEQVETDAIQALRKLDTTTSSYDFHERYKFDKIVERGFGIEEGLQEGEKFQVLFANLEKEKPFTAYERLNKIINFLNTKKGQLTSVLIKSSIFTNGYWIHVTDLDENQYYRFINRLEAYKSTFLPETKDLRGTDLDCFLINKEKMYYDSLAKMDYDDHNDFGNDYSILNDGVETYYEELIQTFPSHYEFVKKWFNSIEDGRKAFFAIRKYEEGNVIIKNYRFTKKATSFNNFRDLINWLESNSEFKNEVVDHADTIDLIEQT